MKMEVDYNYIPYILENTRIESVVLNNNELSLYLDNGIIFTYCNYNKRGKFKLSGKEPSILDMEYRRSTT